MNKFLVILILSVLLLTQAVLVLGAGEKCNITRDCPSGEECYCDPDPTDGKKDGICQPAGVVVLCPFTKYREITELVEAISNWVFYIGIVIFPLIILWGAWTFMTAAGRPDKIETGKKIIFWAIVGLAIILFSRAIISIVQSILIG